MLVRWTNPFASLFEPFENFDWDAQKYWIPQIDVKEEKDQFTIDVEIPGMDDKDIKITVEKSLITIEGKKETEKRNKSFTRSFTLPPSIDPDKIEALIDKGVLTIKIPKLPKEEPKKIEIKVNGSSKRVVK